MAQTTGLDQKKIEEVAFRAVGDIGGAFVTALAYIGDRFGVFKALADSSPLTSGDLAQKTKLNERYVREWLKAMVAAEYVEYEPEGEKYYMTNEQAFVLANEESSMFLGGGFHVATPSLLNVQKIAEAFKNGGGIPLSELGTEVVEGVERMFRPAYINQLVQNWLSRVPGLVQKLEQGATVLDVGCGCGQSTVVMAKAFPRSTFVGVDPDSYSIARARKLASENNLTNAQLLNLLAHEVPKERKYDLICSFDCVHDMADPVRTLVTIREFLKEDGVYLWSEPNASDNPVENRNIFGKLFTGVSPFYCLTTSMAQNGKGTGNQLGEKGARSLAQEAGFSSFEKLPIENPINQFFLLKK